MKRNLAFLIVCFLTMLALLVVSSPSAPTSLAAVPTSVPDTSAGASGNTVGMNQGGTFFAGIAIDAIEEAETALTIINYDSTTKALDIQDSSGNTIVAVDDTGFTAGLGVPVWASTAFTYTAATGFDNGTVVLVPVGEVWAVHSVLAKTTTDVACTGDDETLIVGDASDTDGFLSLAHASLDNAYAAGTGFAVGWAGILTDTQGAYLDDWDAILGSSNTNAFIYDNSAGTVPITMTATLGEGSGETITAGEFTIYVNYTRIE